MSTKEKQCSNCQESFLITESDASFYKKIHVPDPQNCPKCRLVRRLLERNARNLYYRKCDYSGEKIISQYHENHSFPVYSQDIWWSDKWDALDYGQDFDFSKSFFEQFKELSNKVPHFSTFIVGGTLQNSDFTNCTGYLKNCYLICESDYDEDCYYSNLLKNSKNLVDCSICYDSELCYECIDCMNCYNLKYSQDCDSCKNSFFLKDCRSCEDCIGCINQVHKQYMIRNKQYTKDEYEKIKDDMNINTNSGITSLAKEVDAFFQKQFHRNLHEEYNENSFGDHLYHSKNAEECFDSKDIEDCKYCEKLSLKVKDSMDYNSWGDKAELIYQCSACGTNIHNLKFCSTCVANLNDCEYCEQCTACSQCFGCFGLKHKKYCILNKQYSEEEYTDLKNKIIGQMKKENEYGEFFPKEFCTFAYNETIAMNHYPLTKEQALAQGYTWKDPDKREFKSQTCAVTENINDVKDDIIDEILACKNCHKNFKIIKPELQFYRSQSLSIPQFCPDCRHLSRMGKRTAPELHNTKCAKCGDETMTNNTSGHEIYCHKCYLETVI
ncbi:MAG: hypothetical protein WCX95_03160 [Candidatus Gracilibacteria bacterium]